MEFASLIKTITDSPRVRIFRQILQADVQRVNLAAKKEEHMRRSWLYLSSVFHALRESLLPIKSNVELPINSSQPPISVFSNPIMSMKPSFKNR